MTLNAKIGGFMDFLAILDCESISFTRWRHTRLWPMCIMVPMGRVQMICDFRNYNYRTGNAIGFRASRELCSNFLWSYGCFVAEGFVLFFCRRLVLSCVVLSQGVQRSSVLVWGKALQGDCQNCHSSLVLSQGDDYCHTFEYCTAGCRTAAAASSMRCWRGSGNTAPRRRLIPLQTLVQQSPSGPTITSLDLRK